MYPIHLRLTGRKCLVIGGGQVAARKTERLLEEGAVVTLLAPHLAEPLSSWAADGRVKWQAVSYSPLFLTKAFMVFCATDDAAVNLQAAEDARAAGALVNVASSPEASDFVLPAMVKQGDLLLTVATGGKSPAFSRWMRLLLAKKIGPDYGAALDWISQIRDRLQEELPDSHAREVFWREMFAGEAGRFLENEQWKEAEAVINNAIDGFGTQS